MPKNTPAVPRHPVQPVVMVDDVARFKENKIVRWMLEQGKEGKRFDLNTIAATSFPQEDREQLAQLIGYSLSGFSELSYVSAETWEVATSNGDGAERATREEVLREQLRAFRAEMREPIARLYGIHPDDLARDITGCVDSYEGP